MAASKLFTKKEKAKKKDKDLTKQQMFDVSGPTLVSTAEGLYKKLALDQTNIMHQVETITNSLDEIFEGDKPPNYSDVITQLLKQLDSAVSITQKCLTKDIFERNPSLKAHLDTYSNEMYANVALLVKWADFASRDTRYSMNREYIFYCVTRFKDSLNNIVKLVAENVTDTGFNDRLRRSSVNDSILHRTAMDIMNGSATLPHDITLSIPVTVKSNRSQSVKPRLNVSHDSLNSDSSDSDVTINNRRSDSAERHDDSRFTTPPPNHSIENGFFLSSRKHSSPGQNHSFVYPVASSSFANGKDDEDKPPPIPIKKRRQQQHLLTQMSYTGGHSPHTSPTHCYHQHSYSSPVTTVIPPVLVKPSQHRSDYDDVPPPLPTKKNRNAPPLPLRVDSIPGFRSKLENAPLKPPRTDAQEVSAPPSVGQPSLLHLIDHYNKTIQQSDVNNGEAPPIPPKRRTVMIYNQLIHASDYTFDDSLIPSLNIPNMVAPPPIPLKKRQRKPQQSKANDTRGTSSLINGSPYHSGMQSIVGHEDLEIASELEEKVNYLKIEDASPYLSFEQEETGWTLTGGEIDALIAYAASTTFAVKQFTEAFLSTYYTFTTPDELISKLLIRLHHFYKEGNSAVWQATTGLLLRVLRNLHAPLIKEAEITLIELIHTMLKDGNLKFGQIVRDTLVEKLNQKLPEFIPLSIAMCKKSGPSAVITDFDPADVAKQLTVLDADYFYKVDVSEMLYWAKDHNEEKCPRLTLFTMHFNNVSQWIKSRLLEKDLDWKKREKLMTYFIGVMKSLREYGNFNAYLAILSAIESASVSRLDWSERIIKSLEEPRALIDCRGSFKNYRQAFSQTKPPCIPYIGLYLQDLTFLEEQPSKLNDGVSINFTKRWKQFRSVDHIRFAQAKQYPRDQFQPDPKIMGVFNNFTEFETDEKLWERSTDIKPSNRQKSNTHQN